MPSDDENDWREQHLDWSAKQSRILNDNGNVITYYSPENGYPYVPHELPHHYMEQGDTHVVFQNWARKQCQLSLSGSSVEEQRPLFVLPNSVTVNMLPTSPIIGAWKRTIFAGRWEHTSHVHEVTYNIQTGTLFVDLRIPITKPTKLWEEKKLKLLCGNENNNAGIINNNNIRQVLDSLTNDELRLYARQHVFGGYTVLTTESTCPNRVLGTRHHCIDWNYIIGKPRVRPNKWYIECDENNTGNLPMNRWKEWSYATDMNGQCYYYEIWERIHNDELGKDGLCLAMRQRNSATDGIFVVVGVSLNNLGQVLQSSRPHSLISNYCFDAYLRITSTIY
jgi:hypothetical protein